MRVLYVLRYWPTRSETFVSGEIAELRRRGHEVVVAAIGARDDGVGLDPVPGLEVWRPPRAGGRWRTWASGRRVRASAPEDVARLEALQRPKDVSRACWVADRAVARRFDRVHAHFAGEAAEWARLVAVHCGVPWSVSVHAADLFRPRPGLADLLIEARPAVTVCDHHARWIETRYGVTALVVRCGVDLPRFSVDREVSGSRNRRFDAPLRLITVARWTPKKGLDTLLDAYQRLRTPAVLRLVGDAPSAVARTGVDVGPAAPDEVPGLLAAADLFVLPCRIAADGDRDGVPVALMEAMASGIPVVTTAVSGIGELVDDAVGWLVPPDDAQALARAIDEASDPVQRSLRGAAARERVRSGWTLEAQVDGLLGAWGRS